MKMMFDILFGWTSTVLFATGMAIALFGADSAGKFEGEVYPVTENTIITKMVSEGNYTLIWGTSDKIRECSFESIEWRLGEFEHSVNVELEILEPSKVRDEGKFSWGPWRVHLSETQLLNRSFAIVYHNCHIGYQTQTRFYPTGG